MFFREKVIIQVIGLVIILAWAPALRADPLFQNTNTSCEAETVLCDSFSGDENCGGPALGVACKNFAGEADFNGDTFPDCALSIEEVDSGSTTGAPAFNVLINAGAGMACGGSPGQFQTALNYFLDIGTELTSIVAGQLDGANNSDVAFAGSLGFGDISSPDELNVYSALSGASGFGANNSIPSNSAALWDTGGVDQSNYPEEVSDRSLVLVDCDEDGDLDLITPVLRDNPDSNTNLVLHVLRNNGGLSGVVPDSGVSDTRLLLSGGTPDSAVLAVGDFDNQNGPDVAIFLIMKPWKATAEAYRSRFVPMQASPSTIISFSQIPL